MSAVSAERGSRINWRQEYLHLAVIVMTACWLAPWVALSMGWFVTITLPAALLLTTAHLVLGLLLTRWMQHRRIAPGLQAITVLLVMGVAVGLTLLLLPSLATAYGTGTPLRLSALFTFDREQRAPAGPLAAIWIAFLWWRAFGLGSVYMTIVRASFGMRLGLLTYLVVTLLADRALRADTLALIPVFFFFGLLSTSLARADSLSLDRARSNGPFGRGWMLGLLGITAIVTLGGYVAALSLLDMDTRWLADALGTAGDAALTIILVLASPLVLAAQAIYGVLDALIPDEISTRIPVNTDTPSGNGGASAPWLYDILGLMADALAVAVVILIVLLVVAFLWFVLVARPSRRAPNDEDRETLGTAEVVGGFRQAVREGWRRLADALGLLRQFGLGRDLFAALTIRRIYARMERLAGQRGYPRGTSETPYEYRGELGRAFPQMEEDVALITEVYVAVRYGDIPEDPAALERVRAAWQRLQASPEPQ